MKEEHLKSLINQAPVTLFMKGDKYVPQCGFSAKVVEILNKHRADYTSYDILVDPDVRQGLKEYSKWPTFPQLYVDGELIGGCDIVIEMDEDGELESLFKDHLKS
jgi:monothiol glutaredoxin